MEASVTPGDDGGHSSRNPLKGSTLNSQLAQAQSRKAAALTVVTLLVGLVNYAYTSGMGALLPAEDYEVFATAQAFLFIVGTVVSAAVPWFLAQQLASTVRLHDDGVAISFAVVVNGAIAVVAALAAAFLTLSLGGLPAALAAATAAAVVCAGSTTTGIFVGHGKIVRLSAFRALEVSLRAVAGVGLVMVGWGAAAAIGATAIGSAILLGPLATTLTRTRWDLAGIRFRTWWKALAGHGTTQLGIALLAALDIMLAAFYGLTAAEAASYQLAASLSRIPLYLALAAALSSYSGWAAQGDVESVAAPLQRYAVSAIPTTLLLVSFPRPVLRAVYPDLAAQISVILPIAAIGSLLLGAGVLLLVRLQAASRFRAGALTSAAASATLVICSAGVIEFGTTALASAFAVAAAVALLGAAWFHRQELRAAMSSRGFALPPWVLLSGLVVFLRDSLLWWIAALTIAGLVTKVTLTATTRPEVES